jgi:hypothetical protein
MSAQGATRGKGHTHQSKHTKRSKEVETAYIPPGIVETGVVTSVGIITKNNGANWNVKKIKNGQTILGSCNWTKSRNKERLNIGDYVLIQEDQRIKMPNGDPIIMKYSNADILRLESDGHLKQQSVQSNVVSIQDEKQSDLTVDELKDLL